MDRDELAEIAVELEVGLNELQNMLDIFRDLINDFKAAIQLADGEE